jgi:hypothetical protein
MSDSGLSSAQVVTQTGCTYRQLDYWVSRKFLVPEVESTGSGSQRLFAPITLSIVRITLDLIDAGFTPVAALGYATRLAHDPRVQIVVAGGAVTLWNALPESTSSATATASV